MHRYEKKKLNDFLETDLPKTRKEQFFDLLKNRYRLLVTLGLVLFLFTLPFFITQFLKFIILYNGSNSLDEEGYATLYKTTQVLYLAVLLVSVLSMMFGLFGVLKILKRVLWNEPVFFGYDFRTGIKENVKTILFLSVVVWLLKFGYEIMILYRIGGSFVCYLPKVFCVTFIYPILLINAFESLFYSSSFTQSLKTSVALYMKKGLLILLAFLSLFVTSLVFLIPYFMIALILFLVLVLFYLPVSLLLIFECMLSVFDPYINAVFYKNCVHRGLQDGKL